MLYDSNGSGANLGCLSHRTYDFGFTRKTPDSLPSPPKDWVALIQRGRCSFVEKIRFAQELGAKAVIIGNDAANTEAHGQLHVIGGSDAGDLVIPAFSMAGSDYQEMIVRMEHGEVAFDSSDFQGLEVLVTPTAAEPKSPSIFQGPHEATSASTWRESKEWQKVARKPRYRSDLEAIWVVISTFLKIMACTLGVVISVGMVILGGVWVVLKLFPSLDPDHTPKTTKVDAQAQTPLIEKVGEKNVEVEQGWEKVVRED